MIFENNFTEPAELVFYIILSEKFPILRRTEQDTDTNAKNSSCIVPVILARF